MVDQDKKLSLYNTNPAYKESQLLRQKTKITCICNCIMSRSSLNSHLHSNKHKLRILKINDPVLYDKLELNKKIIRERKSRGPIKKSRNINKYRPKKKFNLILEFPAK